MCVFESLQIKRINYISLTFALAKRLSLSISYSTTDRIYLPVQRREWGYCVSLKLL